MSVTDAMREMDSAGDCLNRAMKALIQPLDTGEIEPHVHAQLWKIREDLRDLEARIGEHVVEVEHGG